MSRFDRRLKGVETNSNGVRPGTASCSLPASSVPSRGMLGGMLYNNRNTLLTRQNNLTSRRMSQPVRQNTTVPQQQTSRINGVAVLKDHDDKIKRLEDRLQELENNYVINLSRMEQKIQEKDKLFNLMTGDYKQEMKKMRDYIKTLHQKMKDLDELDIKEEVQNQSETNEKITDTKNNLEIKNINAVTIEPRDVEVINAESITIEQETSEEIAKKTDELIKQTVSEGLKNNITLEVTENE